jgi:glycosyltransferase involved in cell wall biosynthesis
MDYLVEAVRLLTGSEGIKFVFIGEGPMKEQVMSLREEYKLRNLEILSDVPTRRVVDYFNLADVCLVATRKSRLTSTILPVKMFDAWACGKPIVLSVDGEARDHLKRAKAGIWVEPEDYVGIANAIRKLKDSPQLCKEFGANGRKYVERYFSRKTQAERLERILVGIRGRG